MIALRQYDNTIEVATRTIEDRGLVVLRDIHRFPIYGKDFRADNVMISINLCGLARIRYDQHDTEFRANEVAIISPKHTLRAIESSDDYSVVLVVISDDLLEEIKMTAFRHDYQKYHAAPSCSVTKQQLEQLLDVIKVMEIVSDPDFIIIHRKKSLCCLLHVFNEMLTSFRAEYDNTRPETRGAVVFNHFMEMLATHYSDEHEVQFYAKQLHLTPKYFSKIINDVTGKGANAWINEFLINKAKNLLRSRPDLTLQSIGNILGFPEQASFTRFFHKQTGVSPRDYRAKMT